METMGKKKVLYIILCLLHIVERYCYNYIIEHILILCRKTIPSLSTITYRPHDGNHPTFDGWMKHTRLKFKELKEKYPRSNNEILEFQHYYR